MSRQAQVSSSRRPFWLYIDEFHDFMTPSMAEILSATRKYRLGLILAHQELRQLERDRDVASAVLAHPYTRIVFRVGDADAHALERGFSFFEARDLQNLDRGHAIARLERSDHDFNPEISLPDEVNHAQAQEPRERVVATSRKSYGTPKEDVEAELARQLGLVDETISTQKQPDLVHGEKAPTPPVTTQSPKDTPPQPPVQPDAPVESNPETIAPTRAEDAQNERQHTAIAKRIGQEAESLDYTVTYEEPLPAGQGRPDVILRRGKLSIACEVSMTTLVEDEVDHIVKRIAAGFTHVVSVSANRKKLAKIQEQTATKISADLLQKTHFLTPEELISKLYEWSKADPAGGVEEAAKPKKHKISISGSTLSETERHQRETTMLDDLAKRMKKKP
jgi:hypothetical protein